MTAALVETQIAAPCIFCARPSAPHGEHHFRPDNPSQGKGMGGAHKHLDTLICCRTCHEGLHSKGIIVDELTKKIVRFHDRHGNKAERDLTVTDEELAHEWTEAVDKGRDAAIAQARVAWMFRKRYGWVGGEWFARVADIIREATGYSISTGAVYRSAELGTFLAALPPNIDKAATLDLTGLTLAATLGKIEASPELVEETLQRVEAGERRTEIAKELRPSSQTLPKCAMTGEHVCRYCGDTEWWK